MDSCEFEIRPELICERNGLIWKILILETMQKFLEIGKKGWYFLRYFYLFLAFVSYQFDKDNVNCVGKRLCFRIILNLMADAYK